MPEDPSDLTIERFVDDVAWPANQNELVDHLRRQKAPQEMVQRIRELPKEDFRSVEELSEAFHGPGARWTGGPDKRKPDRDLPPR